MASVAVAAFIPAELRPDHLVAAGTLTQAELLARDLGHGRLLFAACPSPHAVTTSVRFSFTGRVAWRDQRSWAGGAGRPGHATQGQRMATPLGWRAYRRAGAGRQPHTARRGRCPGRAAGRGACGCRAPPPVRNERLRKVAAVGGDSLSSGGGCYYVA